MDRSLLLRGGRKVRGMDYPSYMYDDYAAREREESSLRLIN